MEDVGTSELPSFRDVASMTFLVTHFIGCSLVFAAVDSLSNGSAGENAVAGFH